MLADDLEGILSIQVPMSGQEDLPHPTVTQGSEDPIGSQDQVLTAPLLEELGLVGRQPTAPHQVIDQRLHSGPAYRVAPEEPIKLIPSLRLQDLRGPERLDEVGQGT